MSKKVLLVYPGIFSNFFPEIPLPLIYVAWALRKAGYEPEIFDMRIRDYHEVKSADYLFAGVTSMTGIMIRHGLAMAAHLKQLNPGLPVVWGGVHVTLLPEQSLESPLVDIVVRGEGEITVQELAKALEEKGDLAAVKGISYKSGGKVVNTPNRGYMDMSTIDKELAYDLLDMSRYTTQTLPVHTSRGCPFRCGFCYNLLFNNRRYRTKSAAMVLAEMEYVINRFHPSTISFNSEDEFFINIPRVKEILQGMMDRHFNVKWESFCRFDSFKKVDADLLKLIEASGCLSLGFGAESGSKRILDEIIQKDITVEDVLEGTRKMATTKVRQIVSFMSGLPTETDDDMMKSFDLIDRLAEINPNIYVNGIVLYTPYPGTTLFDRIIKEYNYQIPKTLDEWADFKIYRDVGNTWHPAKYIAKYKAVSILSRFPFWKKKFRIRDISSAIIGGERFARFPLNIAYWTLANIAIWRWKHRNYSFPLEVKILEKVLERIRGFV